MVVHADPVRSQEPAWEGESPVEADEGHVTLAWTAVAREASYELQQADDPAFENAVTRYKGPDLAFFTSGLPEGSHYFRVRATVEDGRHPGWSPVMEVQVHYPSRERVLVLLSVGGLLFLVLVGVVIIGHRRHLQTGGPEP